MGKLREFVVQLGTEECIEHPEPMHTRAASVVCNWLGVGVLRFPGLPPDLSPGASRNDGK